MSNLSAEEEAFGAIFWGHIYACERCLLKLATGLKPEEIDKMPLKDFARKLCPVALELVEGFEKSQGAKG